jgi:uncharacterized protein involved in exopolysaccharide biosynthesis
VDGLQLADSTLKFIRQRTEELRVQMTEGAVPDFPVYQKLRARYEAYVSVEEHIRSLLKRSMTEDEWIDTAHPRR